MSSPVDKAPLEQDLVDLLEQMHCIPINNPRDEAIKMLHSIVDRVAPEEITQKCMGASNIMGIDVGYNGDLWKHRSSGMKCNTCMWYVPKEAPIALAGQAQGEEVIHSIIGRCRRHAPTMNGYPVVYPTDWCGDHKLDESKL